MVWEARSICGAYCLMGNAHFRRYSSVLQC